MGLELTPKFCALSQAIANIEAYSITGHSCAHSKYY